MKKILVAILITVIATSICWHMLTATRRAVDKMWLMSAVKAPGGMALEEINTDLAQGRHEAAKAKLELLRSQWSRFESEKDFRGEGIGNIMVEFSRLPNGEAESNTEPADASDGK